MLIAGTGEEEHFPMLGEVSPWVDFRPFPVSKEELHPWLDSFEHRRFLKSHLPLDGLPYFEQVKYIIVARDPRDVFMSLLNHYSNYTDAAYEEFNTPGFEPQPKYDGDARGFFRNWMTRGWFAWEEEGYPFWSNMHHTKTYWPWRHLPNFLFLHYADMRADLPKALRKISDFIDVSLTDTDIARIADAVSFERVKQQAVAESDANPDEEGTFKGGQATFINKGTNGRWKDLLTSEDLEIYRHTRDKVLPADCARWLEEGGEVRPIA